MDDGLKGKTAKGISWGFVDNIANTGVLAIINIILANILSPYEFGVIGLTSIFITIAQTLVDSGFTGAITRKKSPTREDYNTVFYTNLLFSAVIYFILYMIAPLVSGYYDIPELCSIIRVLSLSVIIGAFSIIQKAVLIIRVDFRKQAIVSILSSLPAGIISVILALNGFGVWSLVALQILRILFTTIFITVFTHWIPSLVFSLKSFREMFSFGSRIMATAIINVISTEIFSLVIGKTNGTSTVGLYNRADKFKGMVTLNIGLVIQRVSYPVLASISDERERQKRAYRKILRTTALITFTSLAGLFAISEPFILVLVGKEWAGSILYLRILSLSAIAVPIQICCGNIINANGRSDYTLRLETYRTLLTIIPIAVCIFFGIVPMLYSLIFTSAITLSLNIYYVGKVMDYSPISQVKDILPFLFFAILMCIPVFLLSNLPLSSLFVLVIQLISGVVLTILFYEFFYRCEEYVDIRDEIVAILRKIKGTNVLRKS